MNVFVYMFESMDI